MTPRARMSKKTGECRCLKCCVRRAVNDYYVRQHGDEPGEVIMSMDETMAALGSLLSEIVSAIPDLRERMEVCCEFANTVLASANFLRADGRQPKSGYDEDEPARVLH